MNEPPALSLAAITRFLRIVWLTMLASVILIVAGAETTKIALRHPSIRTFEVITALAVLIVITTLLLRRRYVEQGSRRLAQDPTDATALRRWRAGYLMCYMASESVALYGLCLRYMGFRLSHVSTFYIAGIVMMLFYRPKNVG
jgi:hypothetical protein